MIFWFMLDFKVVVIDFVLKIGGDNGFVEWFWFVYVYGDLR